MKRDRRQPVRAYTLIEVLIVVAIIGISSAVVVPHMMSASTLGIQAAARTVIADLLFAQNEAVVQQRPRRVVFDTNSERYWMEDLEGHPLSLNWRVSGSRVENAGATGDAFVDFLTDNRFEGVSLAKVTVDTSGVATFTDDGGPVSFEFDELGTPDHGGAVGVVAGSQRFVIEVAEFTGRVKVREEK